MDTAAYERYYNLSLKYLSYRPRSEKEILVYLKTKQKRTKDLSDEDIFRIINNLKEYKFLDDKEFTKSWIAERRRAKNKPTTVIRFELIQKGIDKNIIDELLVSEENKDSDLESAKVLADKKMDFYRNLPSSKRREKVINYLLRKGFNYETVKKAVK